MLGRIALWGPLLIAAILVGGYVYVHQPFARDGTELVPVPLSEDDPALVRLGKVTYRGGLDIPRMGLNIGGLSALRWHAESGRLLALTDDARFVWITPDEEAGRLVGITDIAVGDLLGLQGERLNGKERGDSESLTRSAEGGWLVGFERDHRVWRYASLTSPAQPTAMEPSAFLGTPLEDNSGLETLAGDETRLFACAERRSAALSPNCGVGAIGAPSRALRALPTDLPSKQDAVPTDADQLRADWFVVLFRSYTAQTGNRAAISAISSSTGVQRPIAFLAPPLNVDNFEGLAVRNEGGRTFLYIVSDDNFSADQRTLLMKFELDPDALDPLLLGLDPAPSPPPSAPPAKE